MAERRIAILSSQLRPSGAVIDRPHDRLIEDIGVKVDPEAVRQAVSPGQGRYRPARRFSGVYPADVIAV
jgi:hypothetical protein